MNRSPLDPGILRLAVPRGSLFNETIDILEEVGFNIAELRHNDRKLQFEVGPGRTIITTRPSDVPTYVEYGASDVGIVGKDVLLEHRRDVYELLDMGYGRCRVVYATPSDRDPEDEELKHLGIMRVATKFPNITRAYFEGLGKQVETIELRGSIELAPQVDLAEGIVDLTATGVTLKENKLVERAEIAVCTARLIANRVSHKLKAGMINELTRRLKGVTGS
ncbi:MAG: ATP phosphoribosyltransferase [Actinobacteria bacterium]|nr:ATP phosphoribosyltransferase [Actinomycetota bacterium]